MTTIHNKKYEVRQIHGTGVSDEVLAFGDLIAKEALGMALSPSERFLLEDLRFNRVENDFNRVD